MQPMRRRVRKTHKHRPAGGGGHAMFRRLAQNFAAIGVSQNEPASCGIPHGPMPNEE